MANDWDRANAIRLTTPQDPDIAWPMPRQSRIDTPGALHHIMARGIEGGNIFRNDDERILGDDDFVSRIPWLADDKMKKEYEPRSLGMDINAVASRVSEVLDIKRCMGKRQIQKNNGVENKARLISDTIHDKKEITLPAEILSQYVGSYQLSQFKIVIHLICAVNHSRR